MSSIRLSSDGRHDARLASLPLPIIATGPAATDEDKAAMPSADVMSACVRVVAETRAAGDREDWGDASRRELLFVVSGSIEITVDGGRALLRPGNALLVDDVTSNGHTVTYSTSTRLLRVELSDAWKPAGAVPPELEPPPGDRTAGPNLQQLRAVGDDTYFRSLRHLFPDDPLAVSSQPMDALKFITFTSGHTGDWHPDANVNLVCVMAGVLELETSGENAVETFVPGDVCLVQDRDSTGHLLRARGETRIMAITIPEDNIWATAR